MTPSWLPVLLFLSMGASADGEPVRLTTDPGDDRHPMFSPDGKWILFESNRDGNWEIYQLAPGDGATSGRASRPTASD